MTDKTTIRNKNLKRRQEDLRARIEGSKCLNSIVKIADRLENKAESLAQTEVTALGKAADIKLKLLNKCLPDLQSVALTDDEGGKLQINVVQFGHLAED